MEVYKHVYMFWEDPAPLEERLARHGSSLEALLGGKGANLMRMTAWGMPVPPGFTITVHACNEYARLGGRMPDALVEQIEAAIAALEERTGTSFGDPERPLIVSARSGGEVSMPGMMDTVLNIGLSEAVVAGLGESIGDSVGDDRFIYDAYRRLITMYGDVVLGVNRERLDACLAQVKQELGVAEDTEVSAAGLARVVELQKAVVRRESGGDLPDEPRDQLIAAIRAVFDSADIDRALAYRRMHRLPQSMRTAVNVQQMVFGNRGETSASGVAFTRDPSTGEPNLYGEYLLNAQGEDLVAGLRTPLPLDRLSDDLHQSYEQLATLAQRLEQLYGDVQDIEFTVEEGRLWILQTRSAKRTATSALRIAVDLVDEGAIGEQEALQLVAPDQLEHLLHRQFDEEAKASAEILARGVAASPGAAVGRLVFSAEEAVAAAQAQVEAGKVARAERPGQTEDQEGAVILVRDETSPDDVEGMKAAAGILTARGGKTCHAAIVSRQMGIPCVVGCEQLSIDAEAGRLEIRQVGDDGDGGPATRTLQRGDWVSLDGTAGAIYAGQVPTVESDILRVLEGELTEAESEVFDVYRRFMDWASEFAGLEVRANSDTPDDAILARRLGAKGIGLVRTEHMFFDPERLPKFQRLILTDSPVEREETLAELVGYQASDFSGILAAMDGLPVIVRLLDPPLHEFLPRTKKDVLRLARELRWPETELRKAIQSRREANPMLGHRGCRVGITHPEIYRMQVRALVQATCELKAGGADPRPEVMIPLVATAREVELCRRDIEEAARLVMAETGVTVECPVGTMIETPRAALLAGELAAHADFMSFGTNDLTQMTYGLSRDDSEARFFDTYLSGDRHVFDQNPFEVLDVAGVGYLVKKAVLSAREPKPKIEVGICGEHGGEPSAIAFCHELGFKYVSCSTLRVPGATLAAAQVVAKLQPTPSRSSVAVASG